MMQVWRDALFIVCGYGLVVLCVLALDVVRAAWRRIHRSVEAPEPPKGFRLVQYPFDYEEHGL